MIRDKVFHIIFFMSRGRRNGRMKSHGRKEGGEEEKERG